MQKRTKGLAAALFVALLVMGAQVYGVMQNWGVVHFNGTVKAMGVEIDPTLVQWGVVARNESSLTSIEVLNNGTIPITLGMWSENFEPLEFEAYFIITTNYENSTLYPVPPVIDPGATFDLDVTLSVDPLCPEECGSFSFDLFIQAYET